MASYPKGEYYIPQPSHHEEIDMDSLEAKLLRIFQFIFWGIIKLVLFAIIDIGRWLFFTTRDTIRNRPKKIDSLPLQSRFEHTHVVGGSGHGKTQLLQQLILLDINELEQDHGSIIVIDSQGDMIGKILYLADMKQLSDRLILIDPSDIDYPPALNLFDFGLDRLNKLKPVDREKLVNGAISLYEYLFGALLGAELSQRQGVIFRYLARLMMIVPHATIHNLMDFMQEPETVKPYISKLDPISKRFFETQFFHKSFDDTRQQILTRLWGVLSNPVLARMFSAERNKVDLFDAINRGSIILIYTDKSLLKQEGCEILGRFFIALICQAAQERAVIPEYYRRPTFVYIDEAQDYFDESIENLLNQARKYKIGLILAYQNLDQFDQKLRATVMSSTSIKLVGGVSAKDASLLAKEMRCEPETILAATKHEDMTEFLFYIRNRKPPITFLDVQLGSMESRPRLTTEELEEIKDINRAKFCIPVQERTPVAERREMKAEAEISGVSQHEIL
jgi:hypothetical protein